MHASFSTLRSECAMNLRARVPYYVPTLACAREIERIETIWTEARRRFGAGGQYLFGAFSIADAFYAPVATRFRTYGIKPSAVSAAYCEAIFATQGMQEWEEGARRETA
jgi:glutathione S-transferase